jgi:hypothetical protein
LSHSLTIDTGSVGFCACCEAEAGAVWLSAAWLLAQALRPNKALKAITLLRVLKVFGKVKVVMSNFLSNKVGVFPELMECIIGNHIELD